jgi:hypothetical protein
MDRDGDPWVQRAKLLGAADEDVDAAIYANPLLGVSSSDEDIL